jgi:hypothetical protein
MRMRVLILTNQVRSPSVSTWIFWCVEPFSKFGRRVCCPRTIRRMWSRGRRSLDAAPNKTVRSKQCIVSYIMRLLWFRYLWFSSVIRQIAWCGLKVGRHASSRHGGLQTKWLHPTGRGHHVMRYQLSWFWPQICIQPESLLQEQIAWWQSPSTIR